MTVLVENSVTGRGLRAEHGLAYHLRAGSHALLFDTGQSDLLGANARDLGLCRDLDIQRLGPAHCTGVLPTARLRTEFTSRCVQCVVGTSLVFQR